MGRLEHKKPPTTDRIIMWKLKSGLGLFHFGALEDGTVFQQLPSDGWKTIIARPGEYDGAYDLLLGMTEIAESQGAKLVAGPCEFGIDSRIAADIREDQNWEKNEAMLLIGFDMAAKVTGR